jgi:outer membrane protein X
MQKTVFNKINKFQLIKKNTMKKVLRKAIMFVVATAFAINVSAQEKGDMAIGISGALGSGDELTNYGIGAKFQYNILTALRGEVSFTYFLSKSWGVPGIAESKLSMWDASVNVHYLFGLNETIVLYPLAGLGILGTSSSFESDFVEFGSASASANEFGFNFGGGIDFKISDKLVLNGQVKYMLAGDWGRLIVSAGIAYKF